MFSQDQCFCCEASGNLFSDDFELDFGGVLGAKFAHILFFGRPGGQRIHVFLESVSELDFVREK